MLGLDGGVFSEVGLWFTYVRPESGRTAHNERSA